MTMQKIMFLAITRLRSTFRTKEDFLWSLWRNHFFLHFISDKYQHLQNNIYFEITLKKSLFHLYFRKYPYSRKRTFFRSLFYVHYPKILTFERKKRFLEITFKKLFFSFYIIWRFFVKKSCFGDNSLKINISTKRTLVWVQF